MWLAVGFDKHVYFCTGFAIWSFTAVRSKVLWQQSLVVGLELNWTFFPDPYLLELCETAHMLG